MTNCLRKKRAEWSDFSDELDDSDDSLQTACRWRNGNTVGRASVSVGKRSKLRNLDKYNQNELAEVQYRDSVYNDVSHTAQYQLPNKKLSHLRKPSDCLNVSDSDMSLAITHGSSMGTYRTVPNHRGGSYNMSASHGIQTTSSSAYIGARARKKNGIQTQYDASTLPGYNIFRNMNGSKYASNEITDKDVSRLIEAVKSKCLSPAKIQLLQNVLDSTAEGSPVSKKRHSKKMPPFRASTLQRRVNKRYQPKRRSFNAKSDSSDLSSAESDCSVNAMNTMRPLQDNSNAMYSTRMTELKLPSTGLHRKFEGRMKTLSTYDLRNDTVSNVTAKSHIGGGALSNYLSNTENSFHPNHRSTMLSMDCTDQSLQTNMSMRPSFMRRKLFTQSQEYIADFNEKSFDERRVIPNIYYNAEDSLSRRSLRRSVLPRYSRSRRISNTDDLKTRRQTNIKQGNNMTPVLKRLIEKCNTTGFKNNYYLPCVKQRNTGESTDVVSVRTSTGGLTGQHLKKKLVVTSDSDHLTDDVASDCNTEETTSKDRLMEPNPQQHKDNCSPTKNFTNQNTKKTDVIIPCYVHIGKDDIIRNTGRCLKKTSLDSEKDIQYNHFQTTLISTPSDSEPAKDDMEIVKNLANFSEHRKSPYKPKEKSNYFENIECNTAPLNINADGTDKPLKRLTRLSLAKPDNGVNNPTLSIETSDDDYTLDKLRNKNNKVKSSKSISRKSLSLNSSHELQNVNTGSSYFLRPKTVINKSDLIMNHELTPKGQKIETSKQGKLTKKDENKDNENLKVGKALKSGRVQRSAVIEKIQGCTLQNADMVKKTQKSRHKKTEADNEISSTFKSSSQSGPGLRRSSRKRVEPMIYWKSQSVSCREGNMNSGENTTCRDTKQLNTSCSQPSRNDNRSKSVAKEVKSKFWNISSSSSEEEELNKEQNNSSDEQDTHNVADFKASIGHEPPVKAVQLVAYDATLGKASVRHKVKISSVQQKLCSNVQENHNTTNLPTQQFEREPITSIKGSQILSNLSNKVISGSVVKRNTSVNGARNFPIPMSTGSPVKNANVVNNKCNSVIEMNIKPRSGSRYRTLGNNFFTEDDGCCSVISLNTVQSRRKQARFVHFF